MGIRAAFEGFQERQKLRTAVKHHKERLSEANRMLAHVQHLNILLSSDVDVTRTGYVGNQYGSYDSMVRELDRKYRGVADWGNQTAKTIVDVRGAFTIGQGVKPKLKQGKEGAARELQYIREFLKHNNLDREDAQDWASEAELEGKFLARLTPNLEKRQVDVRAIPYISQKYKIVTPEGDYKKYLRAEYHLNGSGSAQSIPENLFVYKRFGGRMHNVNETPPKIGMVLTAIENLEKSLWDWRKINHIFAAPTPYFKAETPEKARSTKEGLETANWKIGKAFVGTADYSLVTVGGAGITDMLEREVTTNAKVVSAGASLPVHFLGFPDLMSNRATADNLMELVQAGTSRERSIWIGFYEELFKKVLLLANEQLNGGFDIEAVGAEIPFVTAAKMREIVDIWLPLFTSNALTLETFLSKVPEVDVEQEVKKIEEKQQQDLERLKLQTEDPAHALEDGDEEENQN